MADFPAREREPFMAHWARIRADPTNVLRTIVVGDGAAGGEVAGNAVSWEQSGHRMIGYWLGRAYWGRGIATAALKLFVADLGRPLHADVAPHNIGSLRVLEKCGFRRVGAPAATDVTLVLDD